MESGSVLNIKKAMMARYPNYVCPLNGEPMSLESSLLIEMNRRGDKRRKELVSITGFQKLPEQVKRNYSMTPLEVY